LDFIWIEELLSNSKPDVSPFSLTQQPSFLSRLLEKKIPESILVTAFRFNKLRPSTLNVIWYGGGYAEFG